jgi:hypothetical protein
MFQGGRNGKEKQTRVHKMKKYLGKIRNEKTEKEAKTKFDSITSTAVTDKGSDVRNVNFFKSKTRKDERVLPAIV